MATVDQNKIDLAIAGMELAKAAVPPTIELIKGRFLSRKTVKVEITAIAVYSFYNPIPMEDYHSAFIKKIVENRVDKNKLNINDVTVSYSISPNVKTFYPLGLSDFGEDILKQDEILSLYAGIDQIRVFIHPSQLQMSSEDLTTFIQAFDDFITNTAELLRAEGKIPLKFAVKHIVFNTNNQQFLQNCPKLIADESLRVYCCNSKLSITYSKVDKLLNLTRVLW
ncbi:MAG: hypothetical protein NWF04_06395 [Candidatus Bathyarchaeota archaeon]|nr:hypothetical protein [Candidatus Bathyarchaeota archaeon]